MGERGSLVGELGKIKFTGSLSMKPKRSLPLASKSLVPGVVGKKLTPEPVEWLWRWWLVVVFASLVLILDNINAPRDEILPPLDSLGLRNSSCPNKLSREWRKTESRFSAESEEVVEEEQEEEEQHVEDEEEK